MRIPYDDMKAEFRRVLISRGFKEEEAEDMDDMAYFDEKWKDEPHYDPYYNYHLL